MKVMGLDVSSTSTGVVVLEYDPEKTPSDCKLPIEALPLVPKAGIPVVDRATFIMERLHTICVAHKPDVIMIEDYGFASQKLAPQAETKGVILFMLRALGLDWNLVAPTRVKKFAGSGGAGKDEVRLAVFKRWGFEHKSNDVVDAYVLAQIGLWAACDPVYRDAMPKFQQEVILALEKGK